MTTKSIVTALTFGFLAFILLLLPVTSVKADCIKVENACPAGYAESSRRKLGIGGGATGNPTVYELTCCTTPSDPYATGESDRERAARHRQEAAQLKAACEAQRKLWDEATNKCNPRPVKNIGKAKTNGESASTDDTPAALKPIRDCKAKGWRWDQSAGKCVKPSEAKANCESKGRNYRYDLDTGACVKQTGEASDEDKPKKKKKKKHDDDDDDDDDDRY